MRRPRRLGAPAAHRRRCHGTGSLRQPCHGAPVWRPHSQPSRAGSANKLAAPGAPSRERDQRVRPGAHRVVALQHLAKVPHAQSRASMSWAWMTTVMRRFRSALSRAAKAPRSGTLPADTSTRSSNRMCTSTSAGRSMFRGASLHASRKLTAWAARSWRGMGPDRGLRSRARASVWPGADLRASTPRRRSSKPRSAGTASTAGAAAVRWIRRVSCLESSYQGSSATELARLRRAAVAQSAVVDGWRHVHDVLR
jgi:hypothetical protein